MGEHTGNSLGTKGIRQTRNSCVGQQKGIQFVIHEKTHGGTDRQL